jgi:hypothetical protein
MRSPGIQGQGCPSATTARSLRRASWNSFASSLPAWARQADWRRTAARVADAAVLLLIAAGIAAGILHIAR